MLKLSSSFLWASHLSCNVVLLTVYRQIKFWHCHFCIPPNRMIPHFVTPTVKNGGESGLVWGFCWIQSQQLALSGTVNQKDMHSILQCHWILSSIVSPDFILQQDNNLKHTSRLWQDLKASNYGILDSRVFGLEPHGAGWTG